MIAAAIFTAISLVGVVGTLLAFRAALRIRRRNLARADLLTYGLEATGTVISVRDVASGDRLVTVPEVRYLTVSGAEVTATPQDAWPLSFTEGDTLVIAYDPEQPTRFTLARRTPGTRYSFALTVAIMLALLTMGVIFFTVRLWAVSGGHGFDVPGLDVPGVVLPSNRPH